MSLTTAVVMSLGTVSVQAEDTSTISLIDNVKVTGEIRPRYEMVETNNAKNNANALTNRLVIGVRGDLFGTDWLSGYAEMTDVHNLNNNYNSTDNGGGTGNNNVVADPEQTRVTQSYLDFKYNKTTLRTGRQMINLDNQRFIGAVGWRQMPQTFNAYSVMDNSIEGLNLMASYLTQVNTIFADNGIDKVNAYKTKSVLLNAKYKVMDELTVGAYGYLLGSYGNTYGLALTGKPKVADNLTLNYRAEYAMMSDATLDSDNGDTFTPPYYTRAKNGKPDVDASYYNLELGMNMSGILAGLGYEFQSGKANTDLSTEIKTFTTPLGTNHKFNGWADVFLVTPKAGLKDANIMLGYKSKDVGVFKAIYHDFTSDKDSIDYGSEIDLLYKRAIPGVKGLTGMLKYADYKADDSALSGNPKSVDVQKFWVMLDFKFSN